MNVLLLLIASACLLTALVLWVEERMERQRRIRRQMRIIERYSSYYVTNYKDPR